MATLDQNQQRQLDQQRLQKQQERLEEQQRQFQQDLELREQQQADLNRQQQIERQQELEREQYLQENEPLIVANEFSDQLQQRLLDAIWAGITGTMALVAATGEQMSKAADGWLSDRLNEGITVLEKTIQDYLKANPNPPAQVLERMAKELGTLEQAMRDRGLPGAPQVAALRQYVLNQREGITIQSDVRPRPELDPNVINIPSADQQVQRPAHTGHSRPEPVDPNAINQPGNEPPLQKTRHTGHAPEQPAVSDVFAQPGPEFVRIQRPGGEVVREFPKAPAQQPPSPQPRPTNTTDELQRNMAKLAETYRRQGKSTEGLLPQKNYEAHHIAEQTDGTLESEKTRELLDRNDISIHDGHLGVYLPNKAAVLAGATETPHKPVHTDEYRREVLQRLLQAEQKPWNGQEPTANQRRQNILNELDKIRHELIQHTFPYRKSELQQDSVQVAQVPQIDHSEPSVIQASPAPQQNSSFAERLAAIRAEIPLRTEPMQLQSAANVALSRTPPKDLNEAIERLRSNPDIYAQYKHLQALSEAIPPAPVKQTWNFTDISSQEVFEGPMTSDRDRAYAAALVNQNQLKVKGENYTGPVTAYDGKRTYLDTYFAGVEQGDVQKLLSTQDFKPLVSVNFETGDLTLERPFAPGEGEGFGIVAQQLHEQQLAQAIQQQNQPKSDLGGYGE
jgi:hypothetical protein